MEYYFLPNDNHYSNVLLTLPHINPKLLYASKGFDVLLTTIPKLIFHKSNKTFFNYKDQRC